MHSGFAKLLLVGSLLLTGFLLSAPPAYASPPLERAAPGQEKGELRRHTLLSQNRLRSYTVYTPAGIAPGQAAPVVFVFHGYLGSAQQVMKMTGFNRVADQEGFLVVYPEVIKDRWYMLSAKSDETDEDVAFVRAMLRDIGGRHAIDPHRLYATGFSNGGFFTHRLACELSDRLAAFASVASTIGRPLMDVCRPERGVPILMINGTDDPVVTWKGKIEKVRFAFRDAAIASVPQMMAFWRNRNECDADTPDEKLLAYAGRKRHQGSKIKRYRHCRPSAEVTHITVYKGGHTWPGATSRGAIVPTTLGRTSHDFHATQVIWDFFKSHPLP